MLKIYTFHQEFYNIIIVISNHQSNQKSKDLLGEKWLDSSLRLKIATKLLCLTLSIVRKREIELRSANLRPIAIYG